MDHSKLDAGLTAALEDSAGGPMRAARAKGGADFVGTGGGDAAIGGDASGAAASAGAAAADDAALSVFIHLDPNLSKAEQAMLAKLGLPVGSTQGGIATATLSPDQVRQLSEQPSVRQLRLSAPLRLLGND